MNALRQALAQEEKPPVKSYCGGKPNYCTPEVTPDVDAVNISQERVDETAKGEQEPVAWVYRGNFHPFDPSDWAEGETATPLYTAPPKREWVGLTEEDAKELYEYSATEWQFAQAIEAKLKEKNT